MFTLGRLGGTAGVARPESATGVAELAPIPLRPSLRYWGVPRERSLTVAAPTLCTPSALCILRSLFLVQRQPQLHKKLFPE
jgi:hypothetical protein